MTAGAIIVTGASSGLGKAIAERFARDGACVVGTSRNATVLGGIAATGITMTQLDVCEDASVEAFGQRLADANCSPEVVIINAGFGISGAIEGTHAEAVTAQFNTNMVGAHRVVRALLPVMRARGSGKLIFIGSVAGRIALPFQGFYSASKAALASYVDTLRIELRPFGIAVILVEPGDHCTGFPAQRQTQTAAGQNPYEPLQSQVLSAMVASEMAGASPESLADMIARIAAARRPRRRYFKMSRFERFYVTLQAMLPGAWFEAVLRKVYRIA
jgi:short-subunit dehydrogenase